MSEEIRLMLDDKGLEGYGKGVSERDNDNSCFRRCSDLDHAVFEGMAYTVYGVEDYQTDYKSLEESSDILPKRLKNSREAAFSILFCWREMGIWSKYRRW